MQCVSITDYWENATQTFQTIALKIIPCLQDETVKKLQNFLSFDTQDTKREQLQCARTLLRF